MPETRTAALNRQLLQLLDAFLVWLAFRAAANLLAHGESAFSRHQGWILYLAIPFTPLILEAVGYYRPAQRTLLRLLAGLSLMALGLASLILVLGATIERPAWLAAGFTFCLLLLRARDTFVARWMESRLP